MPQPGFWRLAWHSSHFQSLHPLPICNWHLSSCCPGADSQVDRSAYILGLCGTFKHTLPKWPAVSSAAPNPTVFIAVNYEALFPSAGTLGCVVWPGAWIAPKVSLPIFIHHTWMWDPLYRYCHFSMTQAISSPLWPPISTPPTHMDEYCFFKSLLVRLPYSSIFWQFWVFFVLRVVVIILVVPPGGKVSLPKPPSWPEVPS